MNKLSTKKGCRRILRRLRSCKVALFQLQSMKLDNSIGFCAFYEQFVESFQAVAALLTTMFNADFGWEWTAIHEATFGKTESGYDRYDASESH